MSNPEFLNVGGIIFKRNDIKRIVVYAERATIRVVALGECGDVNYESKYDCEHQALKEYDNLVKILC